MFWVCHSATSFLHCHSNATPISFSLGRQYGPISSLVNDMSIGTACFVYDFHAETPSGFFWQFLRENKTIYHIWYWVCQSFSLIFISNFLIKSIHFSSSEGLWWIQNIFREKITQTWVCSINFHVLCIGLILLQVVS